MRQAGHIALVLGFTLLLTAPATMAAQESPVSGVVPEEAREAVRLGEAALASPETMYGSVDHYQRAIELAPEYEAAHMGLALAYFKLKQYSDAQTPLERVIALNPEQGRAYAMVGIVYKLKQEVEKSAEAFQNAIRIDPKDHESHFELAFALMRKDRDFEAAEVHARAAHQLNPDVTKTHVLLYTVAAARALDFELIEEELLHILALSPEGPLATRSRVLLEEIHGRLRAQGKTPREVPAPKQR